MNMIRILVALVFDLSLKMYSIKFFALKTKAYFLLKPGLTIYLRCY